VFGPAQKEPWVLGDESAAFGAPWRGRPRALPPEIPHLSDSEQSMIVVRDAARPA